MSNNRTMELCKTCTKTEKEHKTLICTPRGKPCTVPIRDVDEVCVNYLTVVGALLESDKPIKILPHDYEIKGPIRE